MATKRGRTKRPGLTAARIRDTALELIERDGLEELSTRKLGRALGCEAMAIYWYFPSKEALLDAVVDALVLAMTPAEVPRTGSTVAWIDALRELAYAYRALARRYPNAFPLLALRRFATNDAHHFLERLFEAAAAQGLDRRTTARYYRLVASYCSGAALNEIATLRDADGGRFDVDAATFPNLAGVSEYLGPPEFDDVFAFGLELLLSRLAEVPRSSVPPAPAKRGRP